MEEGIEPQAPARLAGSTSVVAYAQQMSGASRRSVNPERQVRLFKNGRNQALRIPRDLELPGNAAILRKEGRRLIVEPVAGPSLLAVLAKLMPLDDDVAPIARPAAEPVDV
jgi:antitoxin VapB